MACIVPTDYNINERIPGVELTKFRSVTCREEESWWLFPALLVLVKAVQARMIDLHIANLEIQDRTLYSEDATRFWES